MNDHEHEPHSQALNRDLDRALSPRREMSAAVKNSVLAYAAHRRPASTVRRPLRISMSRRSAALVTVAASLVLLMLVPRSLRTPQAPPDTNLASAPGDFNRDGHTNIVDAYLLARSIETGEGFEPDADLDGDGRIGAGDVDVLLRRIVKIEGGRS